MKAAHQFNVLSLFSGAMGLDIGLENTGYFQTIGCVEIEPIFCETVRRNREAGRLKSRNLEIINADIRDVEPEKLLTQLGVLPNQIDLLVGGPPCQAFSVFGKRRGTEDIRGRLIFDFIKFVEHIRPKAFIMENVRGLLSVKLNTDGSKGSLFELVQQRFKELGYRTDCFIVNAANYGAPQIRERLIIIGNRFNLQAEFPQPTYSNRPEDKLLPFVTLGSAIKDKIGLDPALMDFSPRKKKYLSMVPPGGNWRSLPIEIQKESMGKSWYLKGGRSAYWRKLSYEFPCPTIVTMPNHAGTSLCHPEELRPLTVGECAVIQGFPLEWEFAGSPGAKYQQIGNAVPIVLGEVAGKTTAKLLEQIILSPDTQPILPDAIVHLRPHVRTRWWWKDGEVIDRLSYSERPDKKTKQNFQPSLFDVLDEKEELEEVYG